MASIESLKSGLLAATELLQKNTLNQAGLAELAKMIGDLHQQALQAAEKDPFDLQIYLQKLSQLLSFSRPVNIEALKDLPRECEITVQRTYMKRKDGKFSKIAVVRVTKPETAETWTQSICIQEFDQLDKHSANKEIGQDMLPVRLNSSGQIEVAITVKNPVGALGTPVFYCPGDSNSTITPTPFRNWPTEKSVVLKGLRRDANRLTGQIKTGLALVDTEDYQTLDSESARLVWFTIPELKALKNEPQFCDASTNYLVEYLLSHLPETKAVLAKLG